MPFNGTNFNQGLTKYLKIPRIMAHCQDEPEWKPQNDDEQWWCESRMGINETRMMYDSISYYLSIIYVLLLYLHQNIFPFLYYFESIKKLAHSLYYIDLIILHFHQYLSYKFQSLIYLILHLIFLLKV